MQSDDFWHINPGQSLQGIDVLDGYEVGALGKLVNYNLDSIIPNNSSWKSHYKVHQNVLPLPIWDWQWL